MERKGNYAWTKSLNKPDKIKNKNNNNNIIKKLKPLIIFYLKTFI